MRFPKFHSAAVHTASDVARFRARQLFLRDIDRDCQATAEQVAMVGGNVSAAMRTFAARLLRDGHSLKLVQALRGSREPLCR
jgi:hypothetical protein